MTKNIIELNGNTYDVRTGKLISMKQPSETSQSSPRKPSQESQNKAYSSMDFHYKKSSITNRQAQTRPKKPLEKSKTLMRSAVSKPNLSQETPKKKDLLQPRPSTNFARIERAAKAAKSTAVKKFQTTHATTGPKKQLHPTHNSALNKTKAPTQSQPTSQKQHTHKTENPTSITERALEYATGHEEAFEPKKGFIMRGVERLQGASAKTKYTLAALVVFGGLAFLGYAFAPVVSVQLAANRSGVAASIPAYKPSGFQLNRSVEYSPGHVALQYESLTDHRNFQIKKRSTDWTSDALKNNFVEDKGLYQTVTSKGKTIYIYNGSNATWVDGGIWYNIEGASSLSSDQLLRIVDSL